MGDFLTDSGLRIEKEESKNISMAVRCAKFIRAGDTAVFDPASSLVEVWTVRGGEKTLLLSIKCSWIKNPEHFRDLAQLMGLNAEPQRRCTMPDTSAPESFWAYRYL